MAVPRPDDDASFAAGALRVDSADCAPASMSRFRVFNPFHLDSERPIHVPGTDVVAWSVEAIWQGTKLVEGARAPEMFRSTPYKRPANNARDAPGYSYHDSVFAFGDIVIDLVTARYAIYLPAYLAALTHASAEPASREVRAELRGGNAVAFYDWDDNFDIEDDSASFSHSAILAAWFGGTIEEAILAPGRRWLGQRRDAVADVSAVLDLDRYAG